MQQIRALAAAGCEIARLAVPDMEAAEAFGAICAASPLPLVADIHFDYRLAIRAAEGGAAKIRINPGNIGGGRAGAGRGRRPAGARNIPIRIGVNGGSLEKRLLEKYGHPTPEALVESAFRTYRAAGEIRLSRYLRIDEIQFRPADDRRRTGCSPSVRTIRCTSA